MKWYKQTAAEVMKHVQTFQKGLSKEERSHRLTKNGYNKIAEKQQVKPWKKFLKHYTDLLMLVLLAAAILKFTTGDVVEGSIIFFVVIINGFVSYWQERKAEESLDGLKQMMGQEAVVISAGQKIIVPVEEVVKGDLVALKAGDVVPADLRLLEVHDLFIEESILTGESEAVEKQMEEIAEEAGPADQKNMAFSGTLVQSGSAIGVAVETGDTTEIGKINHALQAVAKQTTPLVKKCIS
jgi:magnesium-transporting ATPase (P-type)